MPNFQYQSLTSSGESRAGTLAASDRVDAIRQLLGRGETAVQIDALKDGKSAKKKATSFRFIQSSSAASPTSGILRRSDHPSVGRTDLGNFIRELATALEAGLPLMQSLRTVRRQAAGHAMPIILDYLIERIEAGDPLHQAAQDYGAPFDDMTVGMLRAADASGRMSEVLHQLAELLERSVELRREVLGATLYPMIVAGLIGISATILVTVLVPKLIEPLQGQIRMPWPTQVLLSIASFLGSYWYWALIGIVLSVFGWRTWSSTPQNRYRIDYYKLQAPLVGKLLRDVAVARFTRTLGTLTSAGLPILESLRITNATLGNVAMMSAIDEVAEEVTAGKSLADPLEKSGLFPPLLIQVINLGERSGKLDSMLIHAATAFDRQVNNSVKIFTKALPPVLLIVMALMGGFVLAAILLPLLELQSMVG
ncbi:MAG: type II secretion system F family protein [Planctomycetota bacterium]|nr:type II secretion system F family protein [Planctomycetota bacterium]